jgi:plasmid stabilization system protein ParE
MTVIWHPEATLSAARTAEYIRLRDGEMACAAFIDAIDAVVKTLKTFPKSYPEERLFRKNPMHFRSVSIQHLNKIIYRIDGETVYIVDFWDTQMKPWTLITRVLNRIGK